MDMVNVPRTVPWRGSVVPAKVQWTDADVGARKTLYANVVLSVGLRLGWNLEVLCLSASISVATVNTVPMATTSCRGKSATPQFSSRHCDLYSSSAHEIVLERVAPAWRRTSSMKNSLA